MGARKPVLSARRRTQGRLERQEDRPFGTRRSVRMPGGPSGGCLEPRPEGREADGREARRQGGQAARRARRQPVGRVAARS